MMKANPSVYALSVQIIVVVAAVVVVVPRSKSVVGRQSVFVAPGFLEVEVQYLSCLGVYDGLNYIIYG